VVKNFLLFLQKRGIDAASSGDARQRKKAVSIPLRHAKTATGAKKMTKIGNAIAAISA